jgi:hypothetical protein
MISAKISTKTPTSVRDAVGAGVFVTTDARAVGEVRTDGVDSGCVGGLTDFKFIGLTPTGICDNPGGGADDFVRCWGC